MRWLLAAVLAAGCAGASESLPGASARQGEEREDVRVAALDERGLRTALLDVTDFPTGWAADTEKAAEERDRGIPQPQEGSCRALFDTRGKPSAEATAGFLRSRFGPFVSTTDAAYDGERAAGSALSSFREAVGDCPRFRASQDGSTTTYVGTPLDLPALGDGSKAVRYQDRDSGSRVDVVLVRVGSNTALVAQAGRKDMDLGSVKPLAERAVRKLQQVAEGSTPAPDSSQPGATEL